MKKILLLLSVLIIFAMGASLEGIRLVRLTVINKSGMDIEISLTGSEQNTFYYLHIPAGDRSSPTEKVFTVIPDDYSSQLYYAELWDPVYGYSCATERQSLNITGNTRVVVTECELNAPNMGEPPSMIKYGSSRVKRAR